MIDETNKELEHIENICKVHLISLERIKNEGNRVYFSDMYEILCTNIEIIQDIIKKLKTP